MVLGLGVEEENVANSGNGTTSAKMNGLVLQNNMKTLARHTRDVNVLVNLLYDRGILPITAVREILGKETDEEKAKEMYKYMVQNNDREAYNVLYNSVWQTGHRNLASMIKPRVFTEGAAFVDDSSDDENDEKDVPIGRFKMKVRLATKRVESKELQYKMDSSPRGFALIIDIRLSKNHEEDLLVKELEDLRTLFQQLDYDVECYRQIRCDELRTVLERFRKREDHRSVDSTVVIVLGDGIKGGYNGLVFHAEPDSWISTDWIVGLFNHSKCPQLKGKPKIFIFQVTSSCSFPMREQRGEFTVTAGRTGPISDTLVAYAAYPDCTFGRGLSHELCDIFMRRAKNCDIKKLFSCVSKVMRQIYYPEAGPIPLNLEVLGFDKLLYFNPGILN